MIFAQRTIVSLLIHCAFFGLIIYYNKINHNSTSVRVKISESINLTIQINHQEQKNLFSSYNKSKQTTEKKHVNKFLNKTQFKKEQITSSSQNSIIENNFAKEKIFIQSNINPFGNLKIPKKLLSQNLFPKQYYANFTLIKENEKIINFKFLGLTPVHNTIAYLDKTVQKAFYHQLQELSSEKILFWLQTQQNSPYSSKVHLDSSSLTILLEFQEAN